jgi:H+/Cl- antiporter ClcA
MRSSLVSFIVCVNISLGLPLMYANGVAWHLPWIVVAVVIALVCHFAGVYFMSRLVSVHGHQDRMRIALLSAGYLIGPIVAFLLVSLMVRLVAKYHGAA